MINDFADVRMRWEKNNKIRFFRESVCLRDLAKSTTHQ